MMNINTLKIESVIGLKLQYIIEDMVGIYGKKEILIICMILTQKYIYTCFIFQRIH